MGGRGACGRRRRHAGQQLLPPPQLRSDPCPTLRRAADTAAHAGGMSLLAESGIIHGDLSANNVLLSAAANSRRFTAAVSDFGLARLCGDSGRHTETVGTVRVPAAPAAAGHPAPGRLRLTGYYVSLPAPQVTTAPPELLRDNLLSPQADVFAFGVLLWSLYTGEMPFSGELPAVIIHRVVCAEKWPLDLPPGAPPGFQARRAGPGAGLGSRRLALPCPPPLPLAVSELQTSVAQWAHSELLPCLLQALFERCVSYDRAARPSFREALEQLAPLVEAAKEAQPLSPSPSPMGMSPRALRASFRSPSLASPFAADSPPASFKDGAPTSRFAAAAAAAVAAVDG